MDLSKILALLYNEREKLTKVITALEVETQTPPKPRSSRGRKSMGEPERLEVSRRIKKYWALRKQQADPGDEPGD